MENSGLPLGGFLVAFDMTQARLFQTQLCLLQLPGDLGDLFGLLLGRAAGPFGLFVQGRKLTQSKLQFQATQLLAKFAKALGPLSLTLQAVHLTPHFADDIPETQKILPCRFNFS